MARGETTLTLPSKPKHVPSTAFLRATALFSSVNNRNKQLLRVKDFHRDDVKGVDEWQAKQWEEVMEFNSQNPHNPTKISVNCFTCWS